MISSQRLFLLLIGLNLLVGMAAEVYHDPVSDNVDQVTVETQLMEQYETEFQSQEGIWGSVKATADRIWESTIGSPIRWGWTLLKLLVRGLNPFSFSASDFVNPVEQEIARYLIFFRSALMTIVILEGYLLFKNKKAT